MSRWYLTSDVNIHRMLSDACKTAELKPSGSASGSDYYLQSYFKRAIKSTNYLRINDRDWVCLAGTCIWEGKLGEPVLSYIYRHIREGVNEVRSHLIGHYAVAVKKGERITVFTDPQGAFTLYYLSNRSSWLVSNSLQLMGTAVSPAEIDPVHLIANSIHVYLPGENTLFPGVKRLFGSQYLQIDPRGKSLETKRLPDLETLEFEQGQSIDEVTKLYKKEVYEVVDQLAGIDSIAVSATGGLDTRTILAALLDNNIKPQLLHGVGNSSLTNTKHSDLVIVRKLAEKFDLPFYKMEWSADHPYNREVLRERFARYGFKYLTYGSSESMFKELEGGITPYPDLQLGGFTPAFTNSKPWENQKKRFSFDDLLKNYLHDIYESGSFHCSDRYLNFMEKEIRTGLKCCPVDFPEQNAGLETFTRVRLFLHIRRASGYLNFINEFSYFLAPFVLKKLYGPLLNMDFKYRRKEKFQIKLTHEMHSDAFDLEVFSGLKPAVIDLDSYRMKYPLSYRLRRSLEIGIGKFLSKPVKRMVKGVEKLWNSETMDEMGINLKIRHDNEEYVMNNPLVTECFEDVSDLNLKSLNFLYHYLLGVEELGYDVKSNEKDNKTDNHLV